MVKINLRTIALILSNKELKNVLGGSGTMYICGEWDNLYFNPASQEALDQCSTGNVDCTTIFGEVRKCVPSLSTFSCGCSV